MEYRCTFPAGFGQLVAELALRDVPGARIAEKDESSLILDTETVVGDLPYLQSLAAIAATAPMDSRGYGAEEACRYFASHGMDARQTEGAAAAAVRRLRRPPKTFALRVFRLGAPAAVDKDARTRLERRIVELTGLRPDSRRPDLDMQLHIRTDGRSRIAIPLRQGNPAPALLRGELPPHTARLLCELSCPGRQDIFLDPFMGSGALPLERARMGPYKMIFAGDKDPDLVEAFIGRLGAPGLEKKRRTIFPKLLDAADLSRFEPGFFTAIVADPPWGEYSAEGRSADKEALRRLYAAFFREARRVMADGGRLVLLTGRNVPLEEALEESGAGWRADRDYSVLISGKKARALRMI